MYAIRCRENYHAVIFGYHIFSFISCWKTPLIQHRRIVRLNPLLNMLNTCISSGYQSMVYRHIFNSLHCSNQSWANKHVFQVTRLKPETRKSKTEAVLQRRSMLKLGVKCKFMNRYRKCFMPWNVHLEFQVLWLGGVIFLSFSSILGVYAISATFWSLFSSVSK